jgi:two-component system sensor histidine kinase DesK
VPAWTLQRGRQNLLWIYAVGLLFLIFMVGGIVRDQPSVLVLVGRILLVTLIAAAYLGAAWVCDAALWVRWVYVVVFVGLLAASSSFLGWGFVNFGIYVSILISTLIPWRQARFAILGWSLMIVGVSLLIGDWSALSIGLTGLLVGWATAGGIESGRLARKLGRAEQRVSVLAVAAERERIGRDLHDILGHSLTAISIKSGLAAKLIDQDPTAARAEIADIQEIARQALDDVRSTASGFREVRIATEIAAARSVLLAAGIDARTPSAIDSMPAELSELFGYVVREAVTNVVRHSEATSCTIVVTPDSVSISDDGHGYLSNRVSRGSGLRGLTQRVEAAGGQLLVESTPGVGTVLRATCQGADRGSAAGDEGTDPVPMTTLGHT